MSQQQVAHETVFVPDPLFGALQTHWRWMLAFGILSVVLGVIGLGMVAFLSLAGVLMFGILLVVGGGFQLFQAFKSSGWRSTLLHVSIAVVYLALGIAMMVMPVNAALTLTLILGAGLIISGGLRLVIAIQHRGMVGWGWILAAAVASLILGVVIIAGWPGSSLWVIGLFIAVELIVNGSTQIVLAFAARRGSVASEGVL